VDCFFKRHEIREEPRKTSKSVTDLEYWDKQPNRCLKKPVL
jgi:hypothetical protein